MRNDWDPKPGTKVVIQFAPGCEEESNSHGTAPFINGRTGTLDGYVRWPQNRHDLIVRLDTPIEYSPGRFEHFQYFAFHELQPVEEA